MRITLHFSPNYRPVDFNHLHQLSGALHKWLGPNEIHDGLSLYSFGWLQGGERIGKGLHFPMGATLTVSFWNSELGFSLAKGILKDPKWSYGMSVVKAIEEPTPEFGMFSQFRVDGAVVLRAKREDGSREYLASNDPRANDALTRIFRKKLLTAGYGGNHLKSEMKFIPEELKPRSKKITVKGIEHVGYVCPVGVSGTPEAVKFAWLTGAGELTGSGFGTLQ